ncbi:MAG: 2-haloacid dehalogenase [Gammaproteobacteria bacterium]|jgi:2-haloacid dehalogenase
MTQENKPSITLAFDVYGTLINTQGVVTALQKLIGDKAEEFSRTWREKQLEYSFRRGLMRDYEQFSICISNALDYTCAYYKTPLTETQKNELRGAYRVLPAFDDVKESLARLKENNYPLYAFSNGSADTVDMLLTTAGIRDFFIDIVSVDDIKTFKPNPDVYHYFIEKTGASDSSAWLISSNPFDVIGAISAGWKAAWVKRSENIIFDPWGIEPSLVVNSLSELNDQFFL